MYLGYIDPLYPGYIFADILILRIIGMNSRFYFNIYETKIMKLKS